MTILRMGARRAPEVSSLHVHSGIRAGVAGGGGAAGGIGRDGAGATGANEGATGGGATGGTGSAGATGGTGGSGATGSTEAHVPQAVLNERIAQAKRNAEIDTLKALGFTDIEAAKKTIAAGKTAEDANKTELQRAADKVKELEPKAQRTAELEAAAAEYAGRMMMGLTEEQRAVVKDLAGDDAAKQVKTIIKLAPTWAAKGAEGATGSSGTSSGATGASGGTGAAGATTAPPPKGAPNGTTPPATDERKTYEATRAANPFAAASYGVTHPKVYDPKA